MLRVTKALRRPVRLLNNVLLIAVMVGCAAYIVPGFFGYERYVITGGSMSGTFEKGSVAFERQVPVKDLAVGDVITYMPPPDSGVGTLVTHRITKIRPGKDDTRVFRTQGDANPDPDPWKFSLPAGNQPVVAHTVPHLGWAFIGLADPQVRMYLIGVPAAGIALMALRDLIKALLPTRKRQEVATPHLTIAPAAEPPASELLSA
ncbi:signal peptidase I [Nocardioides houyundeii]|uniref:signal peptidase I n=1 Tax=Nocardioides houyundeii TaxID=2045452 RepID=UPI000DF1BD1B|nr:signal peptidase I [Nocardioides houyundeii]